MCSTNAHRPFSTTHLPAILIRNRDKYLVVRLLVTPTSRLRCRTKATQSWQKVPTPELFISQELGGYKSREPLQLTEWRGAWAQSRGRTRLLISEKCLLEITSRPFLANRKSKSKNSTRPWRSLPARSWPHITRRRKSTWEEPISPRSLGPKKHPSKIERK